MSSMRIKKVRDRPGTGAHTLTGGIDICWLWEDTILLGIPLISPPPPCLIRPLL